jgi:hypothetical protein
MVKTAHMLNRLRNRTFLTYHALDQAAFRC